MEGKSHPSIVLSPGLVRDTPEWHGRGARPPGHLPSARILSSKGQRAAAALRHSGASRAAGADAEQQERLGRGKQ